MTADATARSRPTPRSGSSRLATVRIPSIRNVATNRPAGWPSTPGRLIDPPTSPARSSDAPSAATGAPVGANAAAESWSVATRSWPDWS